MLGGGGAEPTEAGDVQDADEVGRGIEGEALVDSGDHVVEQAAVDGLPQGVAGVVGLLHFERNSVEDKTAMENNVRQKVKEARRLPEKVQSVSALQEHSSVLEEQFVLKLLSELKSHLKVEAPAGVQV